jgi:hypothetical protein
MEIRHDQKRQKGRRPGSVIWRENRQKWEARVRLPNGTRPCRFFEREKDAWAWITQRLAGAQQGQYVLLDDRKTGDVLTEYVETVAARTVRPNTLYNYRLNIGYMLPYIGHIKIGRLTRPDIERMMLGLQRGDRRKPLAPHTLNCTLRLLK